MTEKGLAKLWRVGVLVPLSSEGEELEHYSSIQLRLPKVNAAASMCVGCVSVSDIDDAKSNMEKLEMTDYQLVLI